MSKKKPDFQKFGEYLYYAYSNLQMSHYAQKDGKPRYDCMCYVIRANAFKAYKDGKYIHDLFEFNITMIKHNDYCWYCGKEIRQFGIRLQFKQFKLS